MQLLVRFGLDLLCLFGLVSGLKPTSRRQSATPPLHFGLLGAATINREGIVGPAALHPDVAVITALASRELSHAKHYKEKMGEALQYATVYDGYQDLLDNADIDAVYIPLPNGLHYEWTMKALKAGKHVLCEKPFASNAREAQEMVDLAKGKGLVLMEALMWSYHPFRARIQDIMKSGTIGEVQNISVVFHQGFTDPSLLLNLGSKVMGWRMTSEMAGGAMMDLGTYALDLMRTFIQEVPVLRSVKAQRLLSDDNVDAQMSGNVSFVKSGIQGSFSVGFLGPESFRADVAVTGTRGGVVGYNFNQPHLNNKIEVLDLSGKVVSSESADGHGLTAYDSQLIAFVDHVRKVQDGLREAWSFTNTGRDPVESMQLLDQAYTMAGLKPRRGPSGIVPF